MSQIILKNNPTLNNAELILQPQTLAYGLYRFVYTVSMVTSLMIESQSVDTFIEITRTNDCLIISSLKLNRPMFGTTIEITRGFNQEIQFNPYLFTYDIDNVAVITSLSFKYACQIVEANNQTQTLNKMTSFNIDTCFDTPLSNKTNIIKDHARFPEGFGLYLKIENSIFFGFLVESYDK